MSIRNQRELEVTRTKLGQLEEYYAKRKQEPPGENRLVRDLTLRSLKKLINQLTEEVVRYETRGKTPARAP